MATIDRPQRPADAPGLGNPYAVACSAAAALAAPGFDALRVNYATLVGMGLLPRSMLHSRNVDRAVDVLERSVLGPYARRV